MKPISKPFIWLCAALLLVAGLATRSYFTINERLKESEASIKAGDCITLNGDTSVEAFATILLTQGYVTDLEEARFIARHLIGSIRENGGQLQGLGDLSLREYGLKLDDAGLTSISPYPGLVLRAEEMTTPYQTLTPKAPVAEAGL